MTEIRDYNAYGVEIERLLKLRDSPVALKVVYQDELPIDEARSHDAAKKHYAMCQAMTLVRHNRKTITMLKEDNWCLWPLISYGIVDLDAEDIELLGDKHFYKDRAVSCSYFKEDYPRLKTDRKVAGFSLAPLSECDFVPDMVCIYCYPGQLRSLLMAAKYESGTIVQSSLDTCASCVHGQIPVLNGEKNYNLSIPDPGEYERGLCDENEMIFNLRGDRIVELFNGLQSLNNIGFGYGQLTMDMNLDYARPEFYNKMFEKWGLERGEVWVPGVR